MKTLPPQLTLKTIKLRILAVLFLSLAVFAGTAYSGDKSKIDPNPQKDKDVQKGYDDNQREHRQKDVKDHYEVKTSHDGHITQTEPTAPPKK